MRASAGLNTLRFARSDALASFQAIAELTSAELLKRSPDSPLAARYRQEFEMALGTLRNAEVEFDAAMEQCA